MTHHPIDPINPSLAGLGRCQRCTDGGNDCECPAHDAAVILYGVSQVPRSTPDAPNIKVIEANERPRDEADDYGMRLCQSCLMAIISPPIMQTIRAMAEVMESDGMTKEAVAMVIGALMESIYQGHGDFINIDPREFRAMPSIQVIETLAKLRGDDFGPDDIEWHV